MEFTKDWFGFRLVRFMIMFQSYVQSQDANTGLKLMYNWILYFMAGVIYLQPGNNQPKQFFNLYSKCHKSMFQTIKIFIYSSSTKIPNTRGDW